MSEGPERQNWSCGARGAVGFVGHQKSHQQSWAPPRTDVVSCQNQGMGCRWKSHGSALSEFKFLELLLEKWRKTFLRSWWEIFPGNAAWGAGHLPQVEWECSCRTSPSGSGRERHGPEASSRAGGDLLARGLFSNQNRFLGASWERQSQIPEFPAVDQTWSSQNL